MIYDPYFYLCAIPAVLIFALGKGGLGGALGIVSVPLMSLVISPPQAAAILLPILCVMDLLVLHKFWGRWHRENLRIMLPAALLGVVIGGLSFHYLTEAHVRILIGLLALGFALNHWIKGKERPKTQPNWLSGGFWSTLAGFTSFGIHSGGPPVSVYLLPQKLHPTVFLGTTGVFFALVNYVKLIPYAMLGQLSVGNLWTSLVLLPLAPIGVSLGYYLHKKVSISQFYSLFYLFLVLTGSKLLYDGVNGLIG